MGSLPLDVLLYRQEMQESGGNPNAVSPAGAAGVMQIMPATAASPGFGVAPLPWDQRFNADANRAFGHKYMNAMLNRYGGDQARALVAYNWGAGNADKWDGNIGSLPAETQTYVNNILRGQVPAGPVASAAPPPVATPNRAAADPSTLAGILTQAQLAAPGAPPAVPMVSPFAKPTLPTRPQPRSVPAQIDPLAAIMTEVHNQVAGNAADEAGDALQRLNLLPS